MNEEPEVQVGTESEKTEILDLRLPEPNDQTEPTDPFTSPSSRFLLPPFICGEKRETSFHCPPGGLQQNQAPKTMAGAGQYLGLGKTMLHFCKCDFPQMPPHSQSHTPAISHTSAQGATSQQWLKAQLRSKMPYY